MEDKKIFQEIILENIPEHSISKFWLKITENGLYESNKIPVIVLKGDKSGSVIGLTAGIHGDELNGIAVIQDLIEEVNISKLNGTIIAIPGLNTYSMENFKRRFVDNEDLNRTFPGKKYGNKSEQYVWQINQKILGKIDYLVDMHTASFGRVNALYVRADMKNMEIAKMAKAIDADIVLHNNGKNPIFKTLTMRAEAMKQNIKAITVEYGNPQVYQYDIIQRGVNGLLSLLNALKMYENSMFRNFNKPVICKKSYWIHTKSGGLLEVKVALKDLVEKGDLIAVLSNPFGEIIEKYFAPEKGIVIGKSTNPICSTGGRIIHLGIINV